MLSGLGVYCWGVLLRASYSKGVTIDVGPGASRGIYEDHMET